MKQLKPLLAALALVTATAAPALSAPHGAAPDRPPRVIFFDNACDTPLEAAVHYQAPDGQWRMSRWMPLEPDERTPVGWTRAEVYYSTARKPGGAASPILGARVRATVYGDETPTLFGVRKLNGLRSGDIVQVFRCGE